jgi:DNA repair protein RAD16
MCVYHRSDVDHGIKPNLQRRAKTLIVLPTVAIRQWQTEILRFTRPGSLNVHVYHGGNRSMESSLKTLMEADVVLTSFKIIEIEYRKATAGTKIECSICGKKYYPEKLRIHRKYFCGENAQLTEAQSKTKRKKQHGSNSKNVSVLSLDSGDSEEDEIDKQKRMIKKMRESEVTKGGPKSKSKVGATATAAGGKKVKRPPAETSSDSEEDEIDKQKRMIKKMREDKDVKVKAKARAAGGGKKTKGKKDKSGAESGSSGEEEKQRPTAAGSRGKGKQKSTLAAKKPGGAKKAAGKKKAESDSSGDNDYRGSSSDEEETRNKAKAKSKGKGVGGGRWRSRNIIKAAQDADGEDSVDSDVEAAIAEAMRETARKAVPSLLHELSWFRVILDEAHLIKDRSTSTARAAFNLVSLNKWCLTGTPLQNRVGELYSLVRFLRMDPFAFYYCKAKNCNCKSLHYVSVVVCSVVEHI